MPPFKGIVEVGYQTETWGTDLSFIGVAAVDEDSTAAFQPDGLQARSISPAGGSRTR